MALIISCSARPDGNCGAIARYIASQEEKVVHLCQLDIHSRRKLDEFMQEGKESP